MLPNAFVILWDNHPVSIEGSWPIEPYPAKTKDPNKVQYFISELEAQRWVDRWSDKQLLIKEIQFRIMDK